MPFLRLEKAINSFSSNWYEMETAVRDHFSNLMTEVHARDEKFGKIDTLRAELDDIELQAKALQDEAADLMKGFREIMDTR